MPRWLEVTTRVGCKNYCAYCPQDKFIKAYSERSDIIQMSFDTFKKCIDKLPKDLGVHFSGFAEPWLNPECTKMVLYAHKCGFGLRVYTTTVGMDVSDIDAIKEIPFVNFGVHLPDNKGKTKINVDEKYLEVLDRLMKSNFHNSFYLSPGLDGFEEVHPKVKQLLIDNNIIIHEQMFCNRAGNVEIGGLLPPKKITEASLKKCSRLYGNILLPNGDVVLCCMDWGLRHILGNLLVSDYDSLFKCKEFLKILKGLEDPSSDILCRYCKRKYVIPLFEYMG